MSPIRDEVRLMIRRLFFTERLSIEEIAERLGFSVRTVRRAVVIDGGASRQPQHGPFHKESDS